MDLPLLPRPDCDVPIPSCPDQNIVFSNITGFFKNQTRPNLKKSSWEKARLEDWGPGQTCCYTTKDKVIKDADLLEQENLGRKQANDAVSEIIGSDTK